MSVSEALPKREKGYKRLFRLISLLLAIGCLVYYIMPGIEELSMRGFFLCAVLVLAFFPKASDSAGKRVYDMALCLLSVVSNLYFILFNYEMKLKFFYLGALDIAMGAILVILILIATKRKAGLAMTSIAVVFLAYAFFGYLIPGRYGASRFTVSRIINILYTGTEGIYGSALAIMLSTIFLFIIFGGLLESTKANVFFVELSRALFGRSVGSSSKVCILSCALFGTINGSAVANTAAVGSFAIPLMKDTGYSAEDAGAVTAVAATGGQMMPPVMGAGAFLIAELAGVAYNKIVLISFIPAILFYFAIFLYVHYTAKKNSLKVQQAEELPTVLSVLRKHGASAVPLVLMVTLITFTSFSVTYSAIFSIAVLAILGIVRSKDKPGLAVLTDGVMAAMPSIISTAVCCACAGVIIGVISLSGLGFSFSSTLMSLAGGKLIFGLLLVLLLSIVLGMGLPTTPAFILMVSVAGAGLTKLGLPLLVAYLVIFWFSQTSNITPPVCMAAYTAAGICGCPPLKVGLNSLKIGLPMIIIPFFMVYRSLLFTEGIAYSLYSLLTCIAGIFCLELVTVGYMNIKLNVPETGLLLLACGGLFVSGYLPNALGAASFIVFLLLHRSRSAKFAAS